MAALSSDAYLNSRQLKGQESKEQTHRTHVSRCRRLIKFTRYTKLVIGTTRKYFILAKWLCCDVEITITVQYNIQARGTVRLNTIIFLTKNKTRTQSVKKKKKKSKGYFTLHPRAPINHSIADEKRFSIMFGKSRMEIVRFPSKFANKKPIEIKNYLQILFYLP